MNIAKKLLFSLLVCGTLFSAACGDDTAAAGEECTKDKACGDNLVCVVKKTDDDKGVCTAVCNKDEECPGKAAGSCADATVLKDSTGGKVCPAATQEPKVTIKGEGETCADGDTCKDGTTCAGGTCAKECTNVGAGSEDCKSAENGATECKAVDSKNVCVVPEPPATAKGEGETCADGDTCENGTTCSGGTCAKKCTTVGAGSEDCKSAKNGATECKTVGSDTVCVAPAPPATAKGEGEPCAAGDTCENGTTCSGGKCAKKCTTVGANATECKGAKNGATECKTVGSDTVCVAP